MEDVDIYEQFKIPASRQFSYEDYHQAISEMVTLRDKDLRAFIFNYLPRMQDNEWQELLWTVCDSSCDEDFRREFFENWKELYAKVLEAKKQLVQELQNSQTCLNNFQANQQQQKNEESVENDNPIS